MHRRARAVSGRRLGDRGAEFGYSKLCESRKRILIQRLKRAYSDISLLDEGADEVSLTTFTANSQA
jgi:hypothetical protein